MAQEPETEKNASGIAHAAASRSYDAEQVDAFLNAHMLYEGEGAQLNQHDIPRTSPFELVKGGYVIARGCRALPVWNVPWSTSRPVEISQHGRGMEGADRGPVQKLRRACRTRAAKRFNKPGEGELRPKQVDSVIDRSA